ncbi:plasmid replication protein RepC [Cochlodiniinecator piscidefendens]|uniref:plasmid replication protein RepC n=1 Tax=Cochlodiniinecator piscidefendens TaxID=2715756 RepID=UPI00140DAEDE|nr:plasmid replication protein RepC [Cochlodiniinecator piscidefendens]
MTSENALDKWALLSALTQAADVYDISHRTLGVLKILMTFLPERTIPTAPGAAIVFPANRTLSERLNGMPESTLRRHLSRLVALGIVSRHDSPNRKRYARRCGGEIGIAFGFDLSPLVYNADTIHANAHAAIAKAEELRLLRDRVLVLRHELSERPTEHPELFEHVARILRRKPAEDLLLDVLERLKAALNAAPKPVDNQTPVALPSSEMSTTDNQNGRHIQYSDKTYFDSEETRSADQQTTAPHIAQKSKEVPLAVLLEACPEYRSFFPTGHFKWSDLIKNADQIAPMLGITPPVLFEAKRAIGVEHTAITLMCILERMKEIRSPGAYLRSLIKQGRSGCFSIMPMIKAQINRAEMA